MSRSLRRNFRSVLALVATLLLVAAFGQLMHEHLGCLEDNVTGCAACQLALLVILVPPALALVSPVPRFPRLSFATPLLLPAGASRGLPAARGPPAR